MCQFLGDSLPSWRVWSETGIKQSPECKHDYNPASRKARSSELRRDHTKGLHLDRTVRGQVCEPRPEESPKHSRTEGRPMHREEADPEKLKVPDGAAQQADGVGTLCGARGGDAALLAADHPDKAKSSVKGVKGVSCFLSAYKNYVCTVVRSVQ